MTPPATYRIADKPPVFPCWIYGSEFGWVRGYEDEPINDDESITMKTKTGVELIAKERRRQIRVERWDSGHDDEHDEGQLAIAAACYALPEGVRARRVDQFQNLRSTLWAWDEEWWKPTPHDRRRELVKAGALIAAEIDRLNRAAAMQKGVRG